MICFQISIFEPLKTAESSAGVWSRLLWFAFKLVSLNHWKQRNRMRKISRIVVICFQISIFEPLKTANSLCLLLRLLLWFAFKLVSLNHWKQHFFIDNIEDLVVICFQISIFEPLKTATENVSGDVILLWFAFKLVSLNHWKQHWRMWSRVCHCCDLLSN